MKKILLLAIAAMFAQVAVAQNQEGAQQAEKEKTLYIVDGKAVSKKTFEALPPEVIQNIDVYKGVEQAIVVNVKQEEKEKLTVLFGEVKAITGEIAQREAKDTAKKVVVSEPLVIRVRGEKTDGSREVDPLILVKDSEGKVTVMKSVNDVDPNNIKAVSVFKDGKKTEELKKYGDVSKGVVFIELK